MKPSTPTKIKRLIRSTWLFSLLHFTTVRRHNSLFRRRRFGWRSGQSRCCWRNSFCWQAFEYVSEAMTVQILSTPNRRSKITLPDKLSPRFPLYRCKCPQGFHIRFWQSDGFTILLFKRCVCDQAWIVLYQRAEYWRFDDFLFRTDWHWRMQFFS